MKKKHIVLIVIVIITIMLSYFTGYETCKEHYDNYYNDGDVLIDDSNPKCYRYAVFKENEKGLAFRAHFVLMEKTAYFDSLTNARHFHRASAAEKRKIPMLFFFLLNNLDAVRKCLPKKESEE